MKITYTIALVLISSFVYGQTENLRIKHFNIKRGVALEGYDPVSYQIGNPVEGVERYKHTHQGITYFFSSASNLTLFKATPEKYEPLYGGWCSYAMGETGEKVKVDPQTYKIIAGRLYLFYNFWTNNTLDDWNKNEQKLKTAADRNWAKTIQ